jgi:TPR repeat protein
MTDETPQQAAEIDRAMELLRRGAEGDAVAVMRGLAETGVVRAQGIFAWMLGDGLGVAQDYAAAHAWYRRATDAGDAFAAFQLGVLHDYGLGCRSNLGKALAWYECAARRDNADAQYELGWRRREGRGLKRDLAEALFWFTLAARRGEEGAVAERDRLRALATPETVDKIARRVAGWAAEQR